MLLPFGASSRLSRLQVTVCEQIGNITSQHLTVNATLQQLTRLLTPLIKDNDTARLDWLLSATVSAGEDARSSAIVSALAASPCGDGHALNLGAIAALAGVIACCGGCCGRRKVRDRARRAVRSGIETSAKARAQANAARRSRVLRRIVSEHEDVRRLRPPPLARRERRHAYDDLSEEELSPAYSYDDDDDDDPDDSLVMEPAKHHARPLRHYERSSRNNGRHRKG